MTITWSGAFELAGSCVGLGSERELPQARWAVPKSAASLCILYWLDHLALMFAVKGSDVIERPSGEIAVGRNRL